MGAYLSQPKTDKVSTDEFNEFVTVGASSMQGWRNSQEDAHNSILDFDENTAFFAVYDGHGGAEVATYCAEKLPEFLKELPAYKDGHLEQALKDAFLGFDQTLLAPEVIEVLKVLAGEKNFADADDSDALDDDEDDEDLAELHEEGSLPLNEVLEKYKGGSSMPVLKKLKESGVSKPQSPYLRGRRAAAVVADAVNKAVLDPDSKPEGSSTSAAAAAAAAAAAVAAAEAGPSSSKLLSTTKMETEELEEDSTVSSSSSGASKSNSNTATNSAAVESTEAEATTAAQNAPANGNTNSSPDSSQIKGGEQNGNVTSSEANIGKNDVTMSLSASNVSPGTGDATVSGSNDTVERQQNGGFSASTLPTEEKSAVNVVTSAAISSTSKDRRQTKKTGAVSEDDSTDDDGVFDAENHNADDTCQALEYSSEDEEEVEEDSAEEDADYDEDEDDEGDEEEDEESFLANEQFCANMIEEPGKDSGCTAVVTLLKGRDLYVANAGDSRCVVCRNGKAIEMSLDHKPEDEEESARIVKAGGRVTLDGRVNGGLNLSRAIGDHAYKMNAELPPEEQMISALPDVKKLIISPEDEFMVLACDGIWNYMSSEEVVDFVRLRLKDEAKKISEICEELFDACLAPNTMGDGTGCDNMTAVIVRFKPQLLEMPTSIKPEETEDVLLAKEASETEAAAAATEKSLKRTASPTSDGSFNEAEYANKTKRLKTDENLTSSIINTTNTNTRNNIPTKNATNNSTADSSSSSTLSGEQKECDSVAITTNEANPASAMSST